MRTSTQRKGMYSSHIAPSPLLLLSTFPSATSARTRDSRLSVQKGSFLLFLRYIEKGSRREHQHSKKESVPRTSLSPLLLLAPRSLSPPQRKLTVPAFQFKREVFSFSFVTLRRGREENINTAKENVSYAHYPFASFAVDPAFPFVATAETRISRAPLRTFAKRFALSLSPRPEKSLNQRGMRFLARPSPGVPEKPIVSPSFLPEKAFSAGSAR